MNYNCEKPTPSQYAVAAALACLVFACYGGIAVIVAMRAPEEKAAEAAALIQYGLIALGASLAIALSFCFCRRLTS